MKRGQVLFHIFFAYLVTAILIMIILFNASRLFQPAYAVPEVVERNFVWYLEKLAQEYASPLTPEKAEALNRDLNIKIRTQTADDAVSSKDLPTFVDIDKGVDHHMTRFVHVGRQDDYYFAEIRNKSPRTVWFLSKQDFPHALAFPILWVSGFIFLILAMSFISIHWMMRPVALLLRGAEELARGNLQFRMPVGRRGDFVRIARSFNNIAERLEQLVTSKDVLLRDVSHELRSPLTRIGVAAEMVSNEKIKISIREDLDRVEHLIHQILESYRMRSGQDRDHRIRLNISEMLELLVADYKSTPPGLLLKIAANARQDAVCEADAMQLERVFRNIIENAQKYSKEGAAAVEVELSLQPGEIEVTVKDHGIGIPPSELEKVFEPFYRVDKARTPGLEKEFSKTGMGGFGLGLSICKAIVESHGGKLSLSSELSRGTSVKIQLRRLLIAEN